MKNDIISFDVNQTTEFGFAFSDFTGKPFANTVDTLTVEYPDDPEANGPLAPH